MIKEWSERVEKEVLEAPENEISNHKCFSKRSRFHN